MGKYFGTDGFRGEAGVTLTSDHAYRIGRFLGWYYSDGGKKKVRAVIGKDTRRSSYMFEYAIVAGLTASGADAYMLHVTTTPSVSYAVAGFVFLGYYLKTYHIPLSAVFVFSPEEKAKLTSKIGAVKRKLGKKKAV